MDWKTGFISVFLGLDKGQDEVVKRALRLVRCHTKNLASNGDFSCPGQANLWQKALDIEVGHDLKETAESLKTDAKSIIKSYKLNSNGYFSFWLDRYSLVTHVFNNLSLIDSNKNEGEVDRVRNWDLVMKSDKCQLTSLRCQQVCDFSHRLLSCDLVQSDKNIDYAFSTSDKVPETAFRVGPVMDKSTMKKNETSFLQVYKRFYKVLDVASRERMVQSEQNRLCNVHIISSAELQFQLLSNIIGQPAIIDENADKVATFVLYNHARMVQLFQSAGEIQDDLVDCKLLQEEEEWELVFVYLSKYVEVLNDILQRNDVKVNRLIQFLVGLSQAFSRYYNRVHVIKDAPHLYPTQCTRLKLISLMKIVLEHGLDLLNIPCLGRM